MTITESRLQIRSNCVIGYQQIIDRGNFTSNWRSKQQKQLQDARSLKYSGQLKNGTKKRLAKAIDLLVQSAKLQTFYHPILDKMINHRLSFITLTVANSTNITARDAYNELLTHFLQWFRRTMKVTTYVWKAEVQERGQIHYHITTPSYIEWQKIKDKWNTLQQSAGLLTNYYNEHHHYSPNSTDIHEVKHIKNLAGYLIKEFCKSLQNPYEHMMKQPDAALKDKGITEDEHRLIKACIEEKLKEYGKLWDCSLNLKKFKRFTVSESNETFRIIKEMTAKKKITPIQLEQCTIYELPKNDFTQILSIMQIQEYDKFVSQIRNHRTETKEKEPKKHNSK